MKRYLLIACFLLASLPAALAQDKTEVFYFIKNYDWHQSTEYFARKYKNEITKDTTTSTLRMIDLPNYTMTYHDVAFTYLSSKDFNGILVVGGNQDKIDIENYLIIKLGKPLPANDNITVLLNYLSLPHEPNSLIWLEKDAVMVYTANPYPTFFYINVTRNHLFEINKPVPMDPPAKDFRQANWGDSRAMVEALAGKRNESPYPELYGYNSSLGGYPCFIGYQFLNDKLFHASYLLEDDSSQNNDVVFNKFKKLLAKKYGTAPIGITKKDVLRDKGIPNTDFNVNVWITPRSYITIVKSYENGKHITLINYNSKDGEQMIDKEILDDL